MVRSFGHNQPMRYKRCQRCKQKLYDYPKHCAELENRDGTERILVCSACLEKILNMPGVQVIKDNINMGKR